MSIIHDALKKAQEQREENKPGVPFGNKPEIKKKPNLIIIGAAAACALAIIAYLYIPAFHKPKVIPAAKTELAKASPVKPAEPKTTPPAAKLIPEKTPAVPQVKEIPTKERIAPVTGSMTVKAESVASLSAKKPVPEIVPAQKLSTGKNERITRATRQSGTYKGNAEDESFHRAPQRKLEDDGINRQYNEALKLMNSGQLRDAQKIFLNILARKPDHVESLNNMGVLSASLGHRKEAQTYFKRVLEYRSNYPKAYNNLGLLMMSEDPQLAEEYFRKAISMEPDTLEPYLNLSALLRSQKRFAEAAKVLETPVSKDVNDAQLFLSYAVVKDHLGQPDDAIRYYRLYLGMAKQARGRDRIAERLRYLEERRLR